MIFFHRNNKSKNVPWSTDYPDTKLTKSPADSRPFGQIQFRYVDLQRIVT